MRTYCTQVELAAQFIRELPIPEGADVLVLGDTAFDAKTIREACAERSWSWIVPLNPERVIAGAKPSEQAGYAKPFANARARTKSSTSPTPCKRPLASSN